MIEIKTEWKKSEKEFYLPKTNPEMITIAKQKFFSITGTGNPNEELFSEKVEVLFSLAYAIKMSPKKNYVIENFRDYVVYPLEGIWDLIDINKNFDKLDKNNLAYKIMIRQPDFVTEKDFIYVVNEVEKKKPSKFLKDVLFEEIEDGLSVQCMHIGSYDEEPKTFSKMTDFIIENNLVRTTKKHREIYISNFKRTEPSKLKTVLRYFVKENS